MTEELLYIIALTKVKNVGPVTARQLISHCGGVKEIFSCPEKDILSIPNIGPTVFRELKSSLIWKEAEKELHFINKNGITPLFFLQDGYPRRMKQFDDSPILLYFNGKVNLNHYRTVGIVGTRTPTEYGRLMTEKIIEGLIPYNPIIVSGMAYGIDSIAHRKAVESGLATIGILGHGLHIMYPQTNRGLAQKMIENGGLITEFGCSTGPDKENFPMRNRIIATMSDALVVIESKVKGGSMITANFANQYYKDVFAVPGKTDDEKSTGCNRLIKIHKAALIESAEDIAYIMRWEQLDTERSNQTSLFVELDDTEQKIIQLLRENKEMTIDTLHYKLDMTVSEVSALLLKMEFKGIISSLPGKRYVAS